MKEDGGKEGRIWGVRKLNKKKVKWGDVRKSWREQRK